MGIKVSTQTYTASLTDDYVDTAYDNVKAVSQSIASVNTVAAGLTAIRTNSSTRIVATEGQTVFTVPEYVMGIGNLLIYVNGIQQYQDTLTDGWYTETDTTTITGDEGLNAGDVFIAIKLGEPTIS